MTANCSLLSRREAKRRDRREAILDVAADYFLEHGYAGTTMSGIAAALGGSKGTLWSYFPSKEELFSAVLDQVTNAYRERLSEILDPCGELVPTLHKACLSLLEKLTSPQAIALHRLVIAEASRFPEMGRIFYKHAPRHTREVIAAFLEGAMDRGQLRKTDAAEAARILSVLCKAGCHQGLVFGQIDEATPEMIREDAAVALDVFMRTYGPLAGPGPDLAGPPEGGMAQSA